MTSPPITLLFLGSGDAFGSGGRFNTCFCVTTPKTRFLIDCGASSLVAMKQHSIPVESIDCVLLSHYHGDHFAGLPFLLIEAKVTNRQKPLTIAGPGPVQEKTAAFLETLFPGLSLGQLELPLKFVSLPDEEECQVGPLLVTAFPVVHSPATLPHALRIEMEEKTIAYSGDTEWTDELIKAAQGSDLFICECFAYQEKVKSHLDYQTLLGKKDLLQTRKLILTHMGPEMLASLREIQLDYASDGQKIVI